MSTARGIDWADVRQRLATAGAALEASHSVSGAVGEALLAERARALADRRKVDTDEGQGVRVLVFPLGGQRVGVALDRLAWLGARPRLTMVPGMPPVIGRMANVQGDLHRVVDLAALLGLPAVEADEAGFHLAVLRGVAPKTALLIARPDALETVTPAQLRKTRDAGTQDGGLRFVTEVPDLHLLLLDMDEVLSSDALTRGETS